MDQTLGTVHGKIPVLSKKAALFKKSAQKFLRAAGAGSGLPLIAAAGVD
jgi:hypothetical protein